MEFKKYLHLERYGNTEVEGINLGTVYVFPKLDGTNASVWMDDGLNLSAGSRNRILSIENDNAGFTNWLSINGGENSQCIADLLTFNPDFRLFGEWLVPHTIKDYRDDAWRKFYVFDVYDNETERYLPYEEYKAILDEYGVEYIPCQKIIKNGDFENFAHEARNADYLMKLGSVGEGVVLKNYEFINKYGRYAAAKIVNTEFKTDFRKKLGTPTVEGKMKEQEIADLFPAEIAHKTLAKIESENGSFGSKDIPRLLDQSYFDFFKEELWDAIKKTKAKSIDFSALRSLVYQKVKEACPQIF